MSLQHVEIMNRLLAGDSASREAAAKLDRAYVIAYRLTNGPGGETVWWQMRFDPAHGVRLELREPQTPADLTFEGDWVAVMRMMREAKAGRPAENSLHAAGDENVLGIVGPAFAAGQKAATVDAVFPDV
jgi:hypothetical protein